MTMRFAEYRKSKGLKESVSIQTLDGLSKDADLEMSASEYKAIASNPGKYLKSVENEEVRQLMEIINDDLEKAKDVEGEEGYGDLINLIKTAKRKVGEEAQRRMQNILDFLRKEVAKTR